jgi:hypothetical protein
MRNEHKTTPKEYVVKDNIVEFLNITIATIMTVVKSINIDVTTLVNICCNESMLFILETISPPERTSKNFNGNLKTFSTIIFFKDETYFFSKKIINFILINDNIPYAITNTTDPKINNEISELTFLAMTSSMIYFVIHGVNKVNN